MNAELIDGDCFGEAGKHEKCQTCGRRRACEKFTKQTGKTTHLRQGGKYKGRGKNLKREIY